MGSLVPLDNCSVDNWNQIAGCMKNHNCLRLVVGAERCYPGVNKRIHFVAVEGLLGRRCILGTVVAVRTEPM